MEVFGQTSDGSDVYRNSIELDGLRANILSLGGILQDLRLEGHDNPLILGFPELTPYLTNAAYFGTNVGRFANRITGGRAKIDGKLYQFDINENGNLLHGGSDGSARRKWKMVETSASHVMLEDIMPDGHMGFPGNLTVRLTYRILAGQVLEITYAATTDATTLCNFAHHSYFNLGKSRTIDDHELQITADTYLPVDAEFLPVGPIENVAGTVFDLRKPQRIGDAIFDNNVCFANARRDLTDVAELSAPDGVRMKIATTEPGLQIYTGHKIDTEGAIGLTGQVYQPREGFAIEPQVWPDAPNHPNYPSAELRVGEQYLQTTQFTFSKV